MKTSFRFARWQLIPLLAMSLVLGCSDSPSEPGGIGDAITSDQTWDVAGSPYLIVQDLTIRNGATLTLEAGVRVEVAVGVEIHVGDFAGGQAGHLVAQGTGAAPVVFTGLASAPWSLLIVEHPGSAMLTHVRLENGGNNVVYSGATLALQGDGGATPVAVATVDSVTVAGSAGAGVWMWLDGAFAAGSRGLVVTGAGRVIPAEGYPVIAPAPLLASLPEGSYTGNAHDALRLDPGSDVTKDVVLRDRGVPYDVDGSFFPTLRVRAPAPTAPVPVLTLEAGVVLRFEPVDGVRVFLPTGLEVGGGSRRGALVAQGTLADPVVFTSTAATPAAGDWAGVVFDTIPDPAANSLDHVRVDYAGGEAYPGGWSCQNQVDGTPDAAAVAILGWQPATTFLTNSTVTASAGHAVLRGWSSDTAGPDFLSSNTFTDVAGCAQTTPRDAGGGCPPVPLGCP
jgi:hypothetical protein